MAYSVSSAANVTPLRSREVMPAIIPVAELRYARSTPFTGPLIVRASIRSAPRSSTCCLNVPASAKFTE
ncbi:hypothetical protein [Coprobacter secundus]|uniref:hypothetical protein n=1 Tax=Coprobacter secundus TaxID=1501392 RepID=UPI0012FC4FA4